MFEKRLSAFTGSVGITFMILVGLTAVTYFWYLLLINGSLNNIWFFAGMQTMEVGKYLLNLKFFAIIVGSLYLTCSIWRRKLKNQTE